MSVREVNQRWLATMGLDGVSIALRQELQQRVQRLQVEHGMQHGHRPPWWRPLARRRWDRLLAGCEARAIASMRA